jgi:hypothetical protein
VKNVCVLLLLQGISQHINHMAYSLKKVLHGNNSTDWQEFRLSQLQIEIVKKKINAAFPQTNVEVIVRNSKGDRLQNTPLHTVEGSDFFTRDIFDALKNGEADIAVHSLKDMSSEHFFGEK